MTFSLWNSKTILAIGCCAALVLFCGADAKRPFTSPSAAEAEFGHGLTEQDALAGWIALFDGESTYGWQGATATDGVLSGGTTTCSWAHVEVRGTARMPGKLQAGRLRSKVESGDFHQVLKTDMPSPIGLSEGLTLTRLAVRPLGLEAKFNQQDFKGWTVLKHPRRADDVQTKWSIQNGVMHALGGPGAVELAGRYGDIVLQVEVRTRKPLVNGGVFLRSIPGEFMNGYEAQLFNACYDRDPAQPAQYSTGAIDDRLLARRLVSRDKSPFMMTVVQQGPHIATWVNGYQTVDWTDTRDRHENPRQGLRLEPGTIQLQSHDAETDIEFLRVQMREFKAP